MKLLSWIAAIVLLLLTVVVALPFSATGTRWLVAWVNDSGLLEIEYGAGSLFGDLELNFLKIDVAGVDLQLDRVKTQLDLDCFWVSKFCLRTLEVESLALDIAAGEDDSEQASSNPELIEVPYAVQVDKLSLGAAAIVWPGGGWQQGQLNAALTLSGSELLISSADAFEPVLQVDSGEEEDSGYTGFVPGKIFLPLDLTVSQLNLVRPRALIGDVEYSIETLSLSGQWRGCTLGVDELVLDSTEQGQLNARGTLSFDQHWPLDLSAELSLSDRVTPEALARRTLDVSATGDLSQLAITVNSAGTPDVELSAIADLLSPGLPHEGDANLLWPEGTALGTLFDVEGALASAQFMGPTRVQVQGTLDDQVIELSSRVAALGYPSLALAAEGRWSAPRLTIQSLTLKDEATDSALNASGVVELVELVDLAELGESDELAELAETWSLEAFVQSEGFTLAAQPDETLGRLSGQLGLLAKGSASGWSVSWQEVNLEGEVNGLAATAQGSAGIDSQLRLLPGKSRIELNGALLDISAQQGGAQQARLNLEVDDLGRWVKGARGQISLNGKGALDREQVQLAGQVKNLRLGEVVMDAAALSMNYNGASDQLSAEIRSPEIESQSYRLQNLLVELKGSWANHRLRFATQGDVAGELVVAGRLIEGAWQGTLQPTQLQTGSGPWVLSEPVAMTWGSAKVLTMAAHCWRHEEFDLCSEDAAMGNSGALKLSLQGDVQAFNGLLPRGMRLRGAVSSNLDVAWEPDADLSLEGSLQARDLTAIRRYGKGERVSVTWQAIDFGLRRQDAKLALNGKVVRDSKQVLHVAVMLPTSAQGALSGGLTFNELQLATLAPWFPQLSNLGGSLTGKLNLAGSPDNPKASGSLHLENAEVALVSNPTQLKALALDLELKGDSAAFTGSGLLGGGEVNLQGQVLTQPELRVEMAVSGDRHQMLMPPSSEILVSEDLTLVLTKGVLDVRGEVRVHEGVLRHEELPAGSVGLSREVVIVDTLGNVIEEKSVFDVRADIWIRIRDRFQVEGEGVRATLGGELHVTQVPGEDPQVFGSLNVLGGELEAYRQRLQVRRGTIAFNGPPENPELDISAEREIREDDVTVGARLTGRLEEPVLEVFSSPPMPQGEAMSYLVRGRGLDSGAGADGTALALSVGADVVNRSGIVAELNRLPLISDVSFGASGGEDDTAATVSGYIGSRLYLSYGRGLYEPINELTARLYLQSRLWLEVVSRLENSVDLYYSFDID
ncbi:MAG: translocation/assembly module TamB domain-containing protein [Halioglobus sp.]